VSPLATSRARIAADDALQHDGSARPSEALAALFSAPVAAAELSRPADVSPGWRLARQARLTAEERACVRHCHARRIQDFTVGRLCAHRALQSYGIEGFSLVAGPDRLPRWPPGFTGSITHTDGYSAAVIGRVSEVLSLGLDSERIEEVQPMLWRGICSPEELRLLAQAPPQRRVWLAALTFVAKEAFYKCQYPLTHEQLGFDAVCVRLLSSDGAACWPPASGSFEIRPLRPLRLRGLLAPAEPEAAEPCWPGRFRQHDGYLSAAIGFPAAQRISTPSRRETPSAPSAAGS